jgi:hypothetical protein
MSRIRSLVRFAIALVVVVAIGQAGSVAHAMVPGPDPASDVAPPATLVVATPQSPTAISLGHDLAWMASGAAVTLLVVALVAMAARLSRSHRPSDHALQPR